jgi:hypothetical protein
MVVKKVPRKVVNQRFLYPVGSEAIGGSSW